MKKIILMVVLLLTVVATGCKGNPSGSGSGASSASKASTTANSETDALIDELIKVGGFEALLEKMEDKELRAIFRQEMTKIAKDFYPKHNFTDDDLRKLLEISKDEVTQKINKYKPTIDEEIKVEIESYSLGRQSPNANVSVSDDFKDAMMDYLEADEAMESNLAGYSPDEIRIILDITTLIYSKYFTTDEIKHAAKLSKSPIAKRLREVGPALLQEIELKRQSIMENYYKSKR